MAQADAPDTRSTFVAQLLAPITAAKETAEGRRFLRELRQEAERIWSLALLRYHAAHSYRDYCGYTRRVAEIERRRLNVPEAADEAHAQLAMLTAVDRMMHVPAPTIGALRQKQKLRDFSGGRARWDEAIARDRAELEGEV